MQIYGNRMSTCTRKVLMVLAEKGKRATFVDVDLAAGGQKAPAHLERHPFGVIPVLEEDDGFRLYESRAILRYLDATVQGSPLTPTRSRDRALMEQWISVEQSYFSGPAMTIIAQLHFGKLRGQEPKMELVEEARAKVSHVVEVLDRALVERPYLGGESFSLGDITFMPYIEYLYAAGEGELVSRWKNASAWWQRTSERPTWQAVAGRAAAKLGRPSRRAATLEWAPDRASAHAP